MRRLIGPATGSLFPNQALTPNGAADVPSGFFFAKISGEPLRDVSFGIPHSHQLDGLNCRVIGSGVERWRPCLPDRHIKRAGWPLPMEGGRFQSVGQLAPAEMFPSPRAQGSRDRRRGDSDGAHGGRAKKGVYRRQVATSKSKEGQVFRRSNLRVVDPTILTGHGIDRAHLQVSSRCWRRFEHGGSLAASLLGSMSAPSGPTPRPLSGGLASRGLVFTRRIF